MADPQNGNSGHQGGAAPTPINGAPSSQLSPAVGTVELLVPEEPKGKRVNAAGP